MAGPSTVLSALYVMSAVVWPPNPSLNDFAEKSDCVEFLLAFPVDGPVTCSTAIDVYAFAKLVFHEGASFIAALIAAKLGQFRSPRAVAGWLGDATSWKLCHVINSSGNGRRGFYRPTTEKAGRDCCLNPRSFALILAQ